MSSPDILERIQRREANREKFFNVDYQRDCLKDLYKAVRHGSTVIEELKGRLRKEYPNGLPSPSSCTVLLLFDANMEPHFEFRYRSLDVPEGWPVTHEDTDVVLYSEAIYQIVMETADQGAEKEKTVSEVSLNNVKKKDNSSEDNIILANLSMAQLSAEGDDDNCMTSDSASDCEQDSICDFNNSDVISVEQPKSTLSSNVLCDSNQVTSTSTENFQHHPSASSSMVHNNLLSVTIEDIFNFLNSSSFTSTKSRDYVTCPCSHRIRKDDIKDHINGVHLKKKPYNCKNCTYVTCWKKNVISHITKKTFH